MKVDYIAIMQEYHGEVNNGFITDAPRTIQVSDDVIEVRYDGFEPRFSRPSRITYPTGKELKELIQQYRREYLEQLG